MGLFDVLEALVSGESLEERARKRDLEIQRELRRMDDDELQQARNEAEDKGNLQVYKRAEQEIAMRRERERASKAQMDQTLKRFDEMNKW